MEEGRKIFDDSVKYVQEHEQELKEEYNDNFLAIAGSKGIVDNDGDYFKLVGRVQKDFPHEVIICSRINSLINRKMALDLPIELR